MRFRVANLRFVRPSSIYCSLLLIVIALPARAQLAPEGTAARFYFAQLADGGSPFGEQWQTTITFLHADWLSDINATVTVEFYDDYGQPLPLDFGYGPSTTLRFTLPPRGRATFRSRMSSPTVVTGWARVLTNVPVQGTVAFRQFMGGRPMVELNAHGTLPTHFYVTAANRDLGIALLNPDDFSSIPLVVVARESTGRELGKALLQLPPRGHRSFNLHALFPNLPPGYQGVVEITHPTETVYFVAWAVQAEGGLMSTLPSGRLSWPPPPVERLDTVFSRIATAAREVDEGAFSALTLIMDMSEQKKALECYASSTGTIRISAAVSELFGDSDAELAYLIAHEFGRLYQYRTGRRAFSSIPEVDADTWALLLMLLAGYDPYAAAGALGRLQLAAGAPGFVTQVGAATATPYASYSARIDSILQLLRQICAATSGTQSACAAHRGLFHPHFPGNLPLSLGPGMAGSEK